jgi:hypothetical protein
MPACIDCHLFDGGDFTTGIASSEACTIQIIFDGGNFTTGATTDVFHSNTCVIDGNVLVGDKGYASLNHVVIVGVITIEKKLVPVYTRQIDSDPRQPVTIEKDGFIISTNLDPKQPGEFIVVKPPDPQLDGSIFVSAYDESGILAWRPVSIGRTMRDYRAVNPSNQVTY